MKTTATLAVFLHNAQIFLLRIIADQVAKWTLLYIAQMAQLHMCTCAHSTPDTTAVQREESSIRQLGSERKSPFGPSLPGDSHQWTSMTPHDINWRSSIQFLKTYFFTICPTFTKTDIFYTNLQSRIQMELQ